MTELSQPHVQEGILGTAVDAAEAAVFVTDERGRFVAANKYACRMLAYPREQLLGSTLSEIAAGPDLSASVESGSSVGIALLRQRTGTTIAVRYHVRSLNGGARGLAVWVATPHARRASAEAGSPRARERNRLSERELEILQLIADGLENEAIAKELYISTETVKSHVRRILQKLGAHSRTYAVAVGFRRQLVD